MAQKTVELGGGRFIGENIVIGKNVTVGDGTEIYADRIVIGDNVSIGRNFFAVSPLLFSVGNNSHLGNSWNVCCLSFQVGEGLWSGSGVVVGKGGCYGPNAKFSVGNRCFIGDNCIFNTSEEIWIGDDVGIGEQTNIWTHGAFGSPLEGYPIKFASVIIEDKVWLQGRSIVLPGIILHRGCVVALGSVVTKEVQPRVFVAGNPAVYKKEISVKQFELEKIFVKLVRKYKELLRFKGIEGVLIQYKSRKFTITMDGKSVIFDLNTMKIDGVQNEITEDFRDFLRRHGIKFWTNKPFRSILPRAFAKYANVIGRMR